MTINWMLAISCVSDHYRNTGTLISDPQKIQAIFSPLTRNSYAQLDADQKSVLQRAYEDLSHTKNPLWNKVLGLYKKECLSIDQLSDVEIEALLVDQKQHSEIGCFVLAHMEKYPKSANYVGLVVARSSAEERPDWLRSICSLDAMQQKDIWEKVFMYSTSFVSDGRNSLYITLDLLLQMQEYDVLDRMLEYYQSDVVLQEGLTSLSLIGKAVLCAREYAGLLDCITQIVKRLPQEDPPHKMTEKYISNIERFLRALQRVLSEVSFLSFAARQEIIDGLQSIPVQYQKSVEPLINRIGAIAHSEVRTSNIYMLYRQSHYSPERPSVFLGESQKAIERAIEKIRECGREEEKLRGCFRHLLDFFGDVRGNIASQDGTPESEMFGKRRNYLLKTPLKDMYVQAGSALLYFLQLYHTKWVDVRRGRCIDFGNIECMQGPGSIRVKPNPNDLVSGERIIQCNQRLMQLTVHSKNYPLAQVFAEIPPTEFLTQDRLPPIHYINKIWIRQLVFDDTSALIKDIEEDFIRCCLEGRERLQEYACPFLYRMSYAALYCRGSAAIAEYFVQSICGIYGLKFTYGTSYAKGDTTYRQSVDIDALTSTFFEFQEHFTEKGKFYPKEENIPLYPICEGNAADAEDIILEKIVGLKELAYKTKEQEELSKWLMMDLLYYAAEEGYARVLDALLVDTDIQVNRPAANEATALALACYRGHVEVVRRLLQVEDIDVNFPRKDGATPLMLAVKKGHEEIIILLLEHKAVDIRLTDENGTTALQLACLGGKIEIVELMIESCFLEELDKYNLLDFARQHCDDCIVDILEKKFSFQK